MAAKDVRAPNIVLIVAEQQRADTVRAAGADWMITPNLDRLAAGGVLFRRAFCHAATCVASRAAFYTGLYPHNTGVYHFNRYTGAQNWTHRLAAGGYHCACIGKAHTSEEGWRHGYHEKIGEMNNKYGPYFRNREGRREKSLWLRELETAGHKPPLDVHRTMPDFFERLGAIEWPLPDEWHPDAWVGRKAAEWIERYRGPEPFFLHVGFLGPHDLYDPPGKYVDMYRDRPVPPPHVGEGEKEGIPDEFFINIRRMNECTGDYESNPTALQTKHATPERIERLRRHYFANVTLIDEEVGRILDRLNERGFLDRSIVIFTSDHGDNLFDHGLVYKGHMYDTIVNVPLVIRAPGLSRAGRQVEDMVAQFDVAQYFLGEAGVDASDLNGETLKPVMEEGAKHTRRYVYAEEGDSSLRYAPELIAMIRSDRHKLVYLSGGRTGQLFDLAEDPHESRNLWGRPECGDVQARLTAELLDWLYSDLYGHRDLFAEHR